MAIVFWGASELGFDCCEYLIKNGFPVAGLVTVPKYFKISYSKDPVKNVLFKDFRMLADKYHLPLITIEKKLIDYKAQIEKLNGNLFIVVGWYHMIPKAIRNLASQGCVGIHGSLLPKYRGGAPLVWAMINGEKETGVTLFHFESGVDNGDIVDQKIFAISESDHIADVLNKAHKACLALLKKNVPLLMEGRAPRVRQNEAGVSYYPQRKPADGRIDWNWDAKRIKNFIRAQSLPYPGAFTVIQGKKIIIRDADITDLNQKTIKKHDKQ